RYNLSMHWASGWIYWFGYFALIMVAAPVFGLPAAIAGAVTAWALTLGEYSERWTPDGGILSVLSGVAMILGALFVCLLSHHSFGVGGLLAFTGSSFIYAPLAVLIVLIAYFPFCTQLMITRSKRAGYSLAFDPSTILYPY